MNLDKRSARDLLQRARAVALADATGDSEERWKHVAELHRRPEMLVFETAREWAVSPSATERCLGADILGQLGFAGGAFPFRPASVPALEGLLGDPDPDVQRAALVALKHLGAAESLDKIRALARHASAGVRHAVAFALLGREEPGAVETLIELSADPDTDVRDWATFGLGTEIDLDTPRVRDALLARVGDPDEETRAEAMLGLARRRDLRLVEPLRAALEADEVGRLAVEAAGELGAPALLPALEELAAWWDDDPVLLAEALEACRRG